jgi:hypothetical protein
MECITYLSSSELHHANESLCSLQTDHLSGAEILNLDGQAGFHLLKKPSKNAVLQRVLRPLLHFAIEEQKVRYV